MTRAKQEFARKVITSNLLEMDAAKVEVARGRANDATFAQDMPRNHGQAATPLSEAARSDAVTVARSLDLEHGKTRRVTSERRR
ncbi:MULTISPECIES: DUF4142 domain-containing protein [unclassified Rhizobium]|jgi:putative membrane protein|uniref:DUF4142 domain-containing protein n=1 Tax=unclassified Rhizobium TaxID=2613769 RepID=UPI0028AA2CEC